MVFESVLLFGFNFNVVFLVIGFLVGMFPTLGADVLVLISLVCLSPALSLFCFLETLLVDLLNLGVARFFGAPTPPYLASPDPRLRNGFGESDPDFRLAANSRSGVLGCSFSSCSFSSSSSSKDLNFGKIGVLPRPGSG